MNLIWTSTTYRSAWKGQRFGSDQGWFTRLCSRGILKGQIQEKRQIFLLNDSEILRTAHLNMGTGYGVTKKGEVKDWLNLEKESRARRAVVT